MNNIPEHFLKKIQEAKKYRFKKLELYDSGTHDDEELTHIPAEVFELEQLEVLILSGNRLTTIPDAIAQLCNLTSLDLSRNQLTAIPDAITQLENLTSLNLSENQLRAVPNVITQLRNLTSLNLGGNQLTSVPEWIAQLHNLTSLNLTKNELTAVPDAIGQLHNLTSLDLSHNRLTTVPDAIGQLHNLTSLNLSYWLNAVELLSDNSPLVIIKNEKQDRHREINERLLRGQFTNLEKTLATNLATNRGLSEILKEIKHYICHLPHIGTPLPKTWVNVREALEKDSRNHISLDEYLDICQQNGFTERKDSLQLSGYLHDLGVCLHFHEDPLLKKTVILKPKWGHGCGL